MRNRWILVGALAAVLLLVLRRRRRRRPGVAERLNDPALANKVRSEVLGGARFKSATINVDAVDGVVTLRGVLPTPEDIRALRDAVAAVDGVTEVHSYLHLPKTPAPNTQPVRAANT